MSKQKTVEQISFGLNEPADLYAKFLHDAEKIGDDPHRYDLFNFFVTAAVLTEWCHKYFSGHPVAKQLEKVVKDPRCYHELLPESAAWIKDRSLFPDYGSDDRQHIVSALRICKETANASKHFHWLRSSKVSTIEKEPVVKNWSQYFFTPVGDGVYVEYDGRYYTVAQIRSILEQFFDGLLSCLEGR